MAGVTSVSASGDSLIDGLLSGVQWVGPSVTYSFPAAASNYTSQGGYAEASDASFAAVSATQMTVTRAIMALINSYVDPAQLVLSEITESDSVHADIRLGQSNLANPTAYAYFPSASYLGGDIWFGSAHNYRTPVLGGYDWLTHLHEIGHALGLKHGHVAGGPAGVALPSNRDSLEYTVMTYRSFIGGGTGGYTNGSTSYPQSAMMIDIAALQYMYGANYGTNATDTTYTWSPTTGAMSIDGTPQGTPNGNKVFCCIWDGGGTNIFDFTNYQAAPIRIDFPPGRWTRTTLTQLPALGGGSGAAGNISTALRFGGNTASDIDGSLPKPWGRLR